MWCMIKEDPRTVQFYFEIRCCSAKVTSALGGISLTVREPPIFSWYGLAFSFLLWFSTRKGGCGSCNQGICSRYLPIAVLYSKKILTI